MSHDPASEQACADFLRSYCYEAAVTTVTQAVCQLNKDRPQNSESAGIVQCFGAETTRPDSTAIDAMQARPMLTRLLSRIVADKCPGQVFAALTVGYGRDPFAARHSSLQHPAIAVPLVLPAEGAHVWQELCRGDVVHGEVALRLCGRSNVPGQLLKATAGVPLNLNPEAQHALVSSGGSECFTLLVHSCADDIAPHTRASLLDHGFHLGAVDTDRVQGRSPSSAESRRLKPRSGQPVQASSKGAHAKHVSHPEGPVAQAGRLWKKVLLISLFHSTFSAFSAQGWQRGTGTCCYLRPPLCARSVRARGRQRVILDQGPLSVCCSRSCSVLFGHRAIPLAARKLRVSDRRMWPPPGPRDGC